MAVSGKAPRLSARGAAGVAVRPQWLFSVALGDRAKLP